jgi:RimJ/RimL family protein N-acetyltransferase
MPTLGDAEALYDLFADLGIMQALGKEPVSSLEEARVMTEDGIAGWRTGGSWPFVLETASADRRVVGQAGLMIFDTRGWTPSTRANAGTHAQLELGWALIRDCAHERRPNDRLVSLITPDNVRSERVAERLGAIPAETVTPSDSGRTAVVWRYPPST